MVFSMNAQFNQVCQSCAAKEQQASTKAGTRKAYLTGAVMVLVALVYLAFRIFIRMAR